MHTIALQLSAGGAAARARVTLAGKELAAKLVMAGRRAEIRLAREAVLKPGQSLHIALT